MTFSPIPLVRIKNSVHVCCKEPQRFIGFFRNEIPTIVCQYHYDEKELLKGAFEVIAIKYPGNVAA